MAYATLEAIKGNLGIGVDTYDTTLTNIRVAAIERIEDYTSSSFAELKQITDELHYASELQKATNGKYALYLFKHPVASENLTITIDGVAVANSNVEVYGQYGIVLIKASVSQGSMIKASYRYGYSADNTPERINQALVFECGRLAKESNHPDLARGVLSSERVGDYQSNFSISLDDFDTDRVEQILDDFVVARVFGG